MSTWRMDSSQTLPANSESPYSFEQPLDKTTTIRRQKGNKFGSVLRKLFGRKSVKSQIGFPSSISTKADHDPNAFITSATDTNIARSASLPLRSASRHSALRSFPPFTGHEAALAKSRTEADLLKSSVLQPRRASLPGVIVNSPEDYLARYGHAGHVRNPQDDYGEFDESQIGQALSSSVNPKRRSRSAEAYRHYGDVRHSPDTSWQPAPRMSDEIRYWRNSVGPVAAFDFGNDTEVLQEAPAVQTETSLQHSRAETDDHTVLTEAEDMPAKEPNRATFDFGVLREAMQSHENLSLEERMVTVEVKLMDLEYAISKVQAIAPSRGWPSPASPPTRLQTNNLAPPLQTDTPIPGSQKSPISPAMKTPNEHFMLAPTSPPQAGSATATIRGLSSKRTLPSPDQIKFLEEHNASGNNTVKNTNNRRSSITSLTIDHYSTLINIIRREQKARIRLEEQISELQRQISTLKPPSPVNYSRCRLRDWDEGNHNSNTSNSKVRRSPQDHHTTPNHSYSYVNNDNNSSNHKRQTRSRDDESATTTTNETASDNGFQDAYQTPTERIEFEGKPEYMMEGEAF